MRSEWEPSTVSAKTRATVGAPPIFQRSFLTLKELSIYLTQNPVTKTTRIPTAITPCSVPGIDVSNGEYSKNLNGVTFQPIKLSGSSSSVNSSKTAGFCFCFGDKLLSEMSGLSPDTRITVSKGVETQIPPPTVTTINLAEKCQHKT